MLARSHYSTNPNEILRMSPTFSYQSSTTRYQLFLSHVIWAVSRRSVSIPFFTPPFERRVEGPSSQLHIYTSHSERLAILEQISTAPLTPRALNKLVNYMKPFSSSRQLIYNFSSTCPPPIAFALRCFVSSELRKYKGCDICFSLPRHSLFLYRFPLLPLKWFSINVKGVTTEFHFSFLSFFSFIFIYTHPSKQ